MSHIDVNSDIGESYGAWRIGADNQLYNIISSANIACGFHGGDPTTIYDACKIAVSRSITIGAQISYPDLRGFGRRFIDVPENDLIADIIYQIGALTALAHSHGGNVSYIKAHGALYNTTVSYAKHAHAIVAAIEAYDPRLPILGLPGSLLLQYAGERGLRTFNEAFVDRAYNPDGTLVARSNPGSVITDPTAICEQALRLVNDQEVITIDGSRICVIADSLCIHSDTPGADQGAVALRAALSHENIVITAFIPSTDQNQGVKIRTQP